MSKQSIFFDTYAPCVKIANEGTNLFPSVTLAQMALETGYGASIKEAADNVFGVKEGKSWTGKVISNTTHEYDAAKNKIIYRGTEKIYNSRDEAIRLGASYVTLFRVYANISDSIADRNRLLLTPHYKKVVDSKTPEEQCEQLQACGYATGIDYAKILKSIINTNNLKKWDD